jgi:hypothetical protein
MYNIEPVISLALYIYNYSRAERLNSRLKDPMFGALWRSGVNRYLFWTIVMLLLELEDH